MPIYEYRCEKCGVFEQRQRITDDALQACPQCGGGVERLISRNVNIVFKGSGFHVTDYRSDGYKQASQAEAAGGAEASGGSGSDAGGGGSGEAATSSGSTEKTA